MAHETLAQLSNYFIYSAIAVYLLAFFAFCGEWVFGSRSKVAVQSAALTAEVPKQKQKQKVTAAVGGGTPVETPAEPVEQPAGAPSSDAYNASDDEDDDGNVAAGNADADRYGRVAVSLTVLAFVLHLGSVLTRGMSVERVPWGNMYEFSLTVTLMVTATFLVVLSRGMGRWLGVFVMLLNLTTLGVAVNNLYVESAQLVPALDSYWLVIHVASAIVSFAALHIGFIAAVLYLCKDSWERRLQRREPGAPAGKLDGFFTRLPSVAGLDKLAYRVNAIIFPLWTFAIICGAIWAESAWGRYWGWDPKEVWAFITWVAYAAYLHARSTAGWKGRKSAWIALVAFGCFVFNYYLVNMIFPGLHSYAGV